MQLVLASTSPYRRDLLQRLRLPFAVADPGVHELRLPGEPPAALARRLARLKAQAVARAFPGAWVVGSDQVADLAGEPLGKPGGADAAIAQLLGMAGRTVAFHTAVCLCRDGDDGFAADDTTIVHVRALAREDIERYVAIEAPYDCAGSFKAESLGIALFEAIESRDPTALVGLPLIATACLLRQAGFIVP